MTGRQVLYRVHAVEEMTGIERQNTVREAQPGKQEEREERADTGMDK